MNVDQKIQIMRKAEEANRKSIEKWEMDHKPRVKGISVYSFCTMFYMCKEIIIHGWYIENGAEKCKHRRYVDRFDSDILSQFDGFEVTFFAALKKGCIEIYACNLPDEQEETA